MNPEANQVEPGDRFESRRRLLSRHEASEGSKLQFFSRRQNHSLPYILTAKLVLLAIPVIKAPKTSLRRTWNYRKFIKRWEVVFHISTKLQSPLKTSNFDGLPGWIIEAWREDANHDIHILNQITRFRVKISLIVQPPTTCSDDCLDACACMQPRPENHLMMMLMS